MSKLEEMKSCIYRVETANTWVRLQRIWHHLFILLLEETVLLRPRESAKYNSCRKFAIMIQCSPCILLGCVLIIAKVPLSKLEHSLREPLNGKTAKVKIYLKKERPAIKEVFNHILLCLLPPCRTFTLLTSCPPAAPFCGSLLRLSSAIPLYCFNLLLFKKTEFKLKKLVREYNC